MTFLLSGVLSAFSCSVLFAASGLQEGAYLSEYSNSAPQVASFSWWSTISYLFTLVVVFALVAGMAYLVARYMGGHFNQVNTRGGGKVIERLPITPKTSVCIVSFAGRYMVLGVTEHEITLLCNIEDADEIERIRSLEISSPFIDGKFAKSSNVFSEFIQKVSPVFRK